MAVKQSYAMVNGVKLLATYDNATQLWTVEGNAPADSSWSQPDHVYKIELHAEDEAGNKTTMTADDQTYGNQLKLRVLEKTKPTATIVSPASGSVLGASTQDIRLEVKDAGGSGLNLNSVVFKVNSKVIANAGLSWTDGSSGAKVCTYRATNLPDGANKIELTVQDNDGNTSTAAVVNFVISTAAPTLDVKTPVDNILTNKTSVTVSGIAAAGSSAVTLAEVTINGTRVDVGEGGAFSKVVTGLQEGNNSIVIVAKDSLGKTTTVTRNVRVDTKAPVISDVVAQATTVDAGGRIKITFKVVDPA